MVTPVVVAGHETAVKLLDQAIAALLTHPAQLDRVRAGDSSWNDVIDETLWWQAPGGQVPDTLRHRGHRGRRSDHPRR